jgi:hypothetical protein
MKRIFILTVLISLFGLSGLSHAEMYQWVDKEGVMHFSNSPPDVIGAEGVTQTGEIESSYEYDETKAAQEKSEYESGLESEALKRKNEDLNQQRDMEKETLPERNTEQETERQEAEDDSTGNDDVEFVGEQIYDSNRERAQQIGKRNLINKDRVQNIKTRR